MASLRYYLLLLSLLALLCGLIIGISHVIPPHYLFGHTSTIHLPVYVPIIYYILVVCIICIREVLLHVVDTTSQYRVHLNTCYTFIQIIYVFLIATGDPIVWMITLVITCIMLSIEHWLKDGIVE